MGELLHAARSFDVGRIGDRTDPNHPTLVHEPCSASTMDCDHKSSN